ncbi:hypothetical protein BU25DRAFT_423302 [Macroventuria anomochaeta]|uniref:Uncharacterized protein n=1 Tax=Macroventuria anomochaeta TaxID=301207 RepID=A0ACB6RUM0_9PLEO|nr:uncharacterized protein BU25DRAFT_423302 [Macroventuria anomochaeta]KAF2625616.1 hypothetical protein BU25DRAFT_423302 [Macroventuria anomochaeta]
MGVKQLERLQRESTKPCFDNGTVTDHGSEAATLKLLLRSLHTALMKAATNPRLLGDDTAPTLLVPYLVGQLAAIDPPRETCPICVRDDGPSNHAMLELVRQSRIIGGELLAFHSQLLCHYDDQDIQDHTTVTERVGEEFKRNLDVLREVLEKVEPLFNKLGTEGSLGAAKLNQQLGCTIASGKFLIIDGELFRLTTSDRVRFTIG